MNPDTNNDFNFDEAEQQFDDVELPTLDRELGPAERQIARQIEHSFEVLEEGLRRTLAMVEEIREIDFEEVMKDPDLTENVCAFSEVATALPHGLAPIALAAIAARAEFGSLDQQDDLSDAA